MNITYNSKTPQDVGAGLATMPVLTHSEIKSPNPEIPKRDGILYGPEYRGDAFWQMVFHMKNATYDKSVRSVRQWLKGPGTLIMSTTDDSHYEVERVTLTEDFKKSEEYGRINATFEVYPYEFLESGNTAVTITGTGSITNEHDPSMPLYKIVGNGTGQLSVNGGAVDFTVATADQGLFIDTRNFRIYNNAGTNKTANTTGDITKIRLKTGTNSITLTSGFTLTVYPRWGYII